MQRINKFGDPYIIYKDGSKYIMSWVEEGMQAKDVYYEISKQNAEKAMKSVDDGYEVMHFAQYGVWPPTEEEKKEAELNFLRKFPALLIKIPENQKDFSEEELKTLMPKAKKAYEKELKEEKREAEQKENGGGFFDEDGNI